MMLCACVYMYTCTCMYTMLTRKIILLFQPLIALCCPDMWHIYKGVPAPTLLKGPGKNPS